MGEKGSRWLYCFRMESVFLGELFPGLVDWAQLQGQLHGISSPECFKHWGSGEVREKSPASMLCGAEPLLFLNMSLFDPDLMNSWLVNSCQNLKPMADLEKQMNNFVMLMGVYPSECCIKQSPMIKIRVAYFSSSICATRKLMWEVAYPSSWLLYLSLFSQ